MMVYVWSRQRGASWRSQDKASQGNAKATGHNALQRRAAVQPKAGLALLRAALRRSVQHVSPRAHTNTHTHTHTDIYIYIYVYLSMYIYIYIFVYLFYIYIYIYIYISETSIGLWAFALCRSVFVFVRLISASDSLRPLLVHQIDALTETTDERS